MQLLLGAFAGFGVALAGWITDFQVGIIFLFDNTFVKILCPGLNRFNALAC